MDTLQEKMGVLVGQYGIHAVMNATLVEATKAHLAASNPPPPCPKGYYRNSKGDCVLDAG